MENVSYKKINEITIVENKKYILIVTNLIWLLFNIKYQYILFWFECFKNSSQKKEEIHVHGMKIYIYKLCLR